MFPEYLLSARLDPTTLTNECNCLLSFREFNSYFLSVTHNNELVIQHLHFQVKVTLELKN